MKGEGDTAAGGLLGDEVGLDAVAGEGGNIGKECLEESLNFFFWGVVSRNEERRDADGLAWPRDTLVGFFRDRHGKKMGLEGVETLAERVGEGEDVKLL